MENKPHLGSENIQLLFLLADIRAAVGDPTGKLMQDELVEHCKAMRSALQKLEAIESSDNARKDIKRVKAIAREGLRLRKKHTK